MYVVDDVDYSEYSMLQLVSAPAVLISVALLVLALTYVITGSPVSLGFEFTGGVNVQIDDDVTVDEVESEFGSIEGAPEPENVRSISDGAVVRYGPLNEDELSAVQDYRDSNYPDATVSTVSAAFGASLLYQGVVAVVFAFGLMTLIVFAFFRSFVPAAGIVASAFSDMTVPIAAMTLLGIEMSLATIPAILLLIGYSIDSDILLTRNTLKGRRSEFYTNVRTAMRTGITMTTTSMAAMAVMAVIAHLFSVFVLRDIGVILFVGLATDLVNTYMMNVGVLRWYVLKDLHEGVEVT
ncbi:MAG: protein translocase subunit SecF [Halobacteriales archaeon]